MESLSLAHLQEEITRAGVKNPKISFENQLLTISSYPYFDDIILELVILIATVGAFLEPAAFLVGIFFLCIGCYLFYINFIGLGKCVVDFNTQTIDIKNRIFLFNLFRKMFGINLRIKFSELKEISYKEGPLLDRLQKYNFNKRYHLLFETHEDPPVIITQFKDEAEAKKITAILQRVILRKDKTKEAW